MPGTFDRDKMMEMYVQMVRIRLFEEKIDQLFMKGVLPGSVHTSIGQEAVAVGICQALQEDDLVIGGHRSHGLCVLKKMDPKKMFAELMGKKTGSCKGKGGSMHLMDASKGMLGANAVVGQQMPIAAGVGLALQLKNRKQICACFFGDGASNSGAFHEALNFAAIWKLPVLFVCENNLYALSASCLETTSVKDIADRSKGYGIPGFVVDGMDALAVYEAAVPAVERVRRGDGPALVEAKTYRFLGHSRGDPPYGPYRTKEELESWKKRDSIKRMAATLGLPAGEVDRIRKEIAEEYEAAVRYAEESPYPELEAYAEDIYV
jgi:TPP-dependent pyruvate/acetoin dehydrogenase alpha subunit